MSLFILATGNLIADPVRRTGAKGDFATAQLRVVAEDTSVLVSVIAFGQQAEALLAHSQDAAVAVAGRAKLSSWTGKDGAQRCGISVTIEQLASASAARRAEAGRRPDKRTALSDTGAGQ